MELSPVAAVFWIDHILDQIFDELAKSPASKDALLNCRLVSHRWLSFAMKPLEKLVHLKFCNNMLTLKPTRSTSNCLNTLTQLLQQPNTFPAIKFDFSFCSKDIPSDEIFTGFLPTYGINITQLSLTNFSFSSHESVIMEQVETLLSLTPNLLQLTLNTPTTVSWENGGERAWFSELLSSDPEFHQILQRCSTKERNTSLKVLYLWGHLSAKVFETILQLAPNVEQVSLDLLSKVHLLQPVPRVHLIRDLKIVPVLKCVELWERIALAYEQGTTARSQLEHITIYLLDEAFDRLSPDSPEMLDRTVNVVSRVLKICSCSLQTITWYGLKVLHRQGNGIKWPKLLPQLWKLELQNPQRELIGERRYGLFPSETNLAAMCPQLRLVAFNFASYQNIGDKTNVESLINVLNFDPVESVQEIELIKDIPDPIVLSEARNRLRRLFPNAQQMNKKKLHYFNFD